MRTPMDLGWVDVRGADESVLLGSIGLGSRS